MGLKFIFIMLTYHHALTYAIVISQLQACVINYKALHGQAGELGVG